MLKKFSGLIVGLALLFAGPAIAADFSLDGNLRLQCGTATATGGAATLNNKCGVITTEALTAPASSNYTLTLTNSQIATGDILLYSVDYGTSTTGIAVPGIVGYSAGSATINVRQLTATNFNGTLRIRYLVVKP